MRLRIQGGGGRRRGEGTPGRSPGSRRPKDLGALERAPDALRLRLRRCRALRRGSRCRKVDHGRSIAIEQQKTDSFAIRAADLCSCGEKQDSVMLGCRYPRASSRVTDRPSDRLCAVAAGARSRWRGPGRPGAWSRRRRRSDGAGSGAAGAGGAGAGGTGGRRSDGAGAGGVTGWRRAQPAVCTPRSETLSVLGRTGCVAHGVGADGGRASRTRAGRGLRDGAERWRRYQSMVRSAVVVRGSPFYDVLVSRARAGAIACRAAGPRWSELGRSG